MKHLYFLKKSYLSIVPHCLIAYLLIFSYVVFEIATGSFSAHIALLVICSTFLILLVMRYEKTAGLYIFETKVYYKSIRIHRIDFNEIKAIKIIPAYGFSKSIGFYRLYDKDKKPLYSIFLLNNITSEMYQLNRGDYWFKKKFREHILYSAIYDENAVGYLKKINPTIKTI